MKKTLFISLLAVLAVAFSCQRVDENIDLVKSEKYPNVRATIAADTRISLEGVSLQWKVGDQIAITKDGKTAIYRALSAGVTSEFEFVSGEWGEGSGSMVAYYPATLAEDGFAAVYTSEAGELVSLPLRGEITDLEDNFTFRPFGGLFKFNVSKTSDCPEVNLAQITITANENIAGAFTDNTASPETATATIDGTGRTIALNLSSQLALSGEAASVYVAVPALTYTSGLTVTFRCDNCIKKVVTTSDITIERAHIQPVAVTISPSTATDGVVRISNDNGATYMAYESLAEAMDNMLSETDGCRLEVLKDFTIDNRVSLKRKFFTFDGCGHTVSFTGNYPEITTNYAGGIVVDTSSNVHFINTSFEGPGLDVKTTDRPFSVVHATAVFGENVTISGFKNSRPYGGAIWANPFSTLVLCDNVKITDCYNDPATSSYGGGAICSDGEVIMRDDASISNCTSAFYGGAILSNQSTKAGAKSSLTISGNAEIYNCTSTKNGGAFYSNTTTNISDNVSIHDCSSAANGGAMEVRATVNIGGNTCIADCSAQNGGAIIVGAADGVLTISGSTVIRNCCALTGAGGAVRSNYIGAKVTLKGNSTIDGCTAVTSGGAVDCFGYFTMQDNAVISGCSAEFGGGVKVSRSATFCGDAKILECYAGHGGAIIDSTVTSYDKSGYGQMVMKGNFKIDKCSAERGGGIYAANFKCTLCAISENASITNCVAECSGSPLGGGIFADGAVEIGDNAVINGNTLNSTDGGTGYGSAICAGSGKVTINGGSITSMWLGNLIGVSEAAGSIDVKGGAIANFGYGSIFDKVSDSCGPITLSGGYFNKGCGDSAVLASGYEFAANPNSSAADQAAYEAGCIYVVKPM